MDQRFRHKFRKLALVEFDAKQLRTSGANAPNIDQLLEATDLTDEIFWQQISTDCDRDSLLAQAGDDEELKEILLFNYGPYDRLNDDAPILSCGQKFAGVGFYPKCLTRDDFLSYVKTHPEHRSALESPYTVVRQSNSHLAATPYHEVYKNGLSRLSNTLMAASKIEPHAHFREYLSQRAKDLLTDNYDQSEKLWVCLEDNPIDLVVGPYEVYEDLLMGLKASYEAILLTRDSAASNEILHFQAESGTLSRSLKPELGKLLTFQDARIRLSVANLVYAGGEARTATPAIAFNLPNDERVIEEVGSRQIILKNVLEAKFEFVAWPLLMNLLQQPKSDKETTFRTFFRHTLFHEISHSIGPHRISKDGEWTTVNRSLRQYYSILEEAKADTLAACFILMRHEDDARAFLESYVSGFVRAIRFGLASAHGGSNAIQFNFFLHENAISIASETGKLVINGSSFRQSIFKLAGEIIGIQERGDFNAAKHFFETYCIISSEIETLINKINDFPIDIRIRYNVGK